MAKNAFVGGTKIGQPRFPVRGMNETMLGAFPVAGEAHLAFPAIVRQHFELITAELALFQ